MAYSPDGRLLAMAMRPDGVRIARASDGAGLARLPIGECDEVLFLPGGDLLTSNLQGLCRWPVRGHPGGTFRIGPPEPLALFAQPISSINVGLASSASGRLIGAVFPTHASPMLVDQDRRGRRTWLRAHHGLVGLAISPDGRRIATAGKGEVPGRHVVKIWDATTGDVVASYPDAGPPLVFSPDGRWLGMGLETGYRLVRTGTWATGPAIDRGASGVNVPMAFHPGSRVVAVLDTQSSAVRLIDVETRDVLATLESYDRTWATSLAFSPDGRHLAAAQADQRVLLWDLAAIRRRVDAMHLAEGFPDVFESASSPAVPDVERIEVEGVDPVGLGLLATRQAIQETRILWRGLLDPDLQDAEELSMRGDLRARLGQWKLAVADYRAALATSPDSSSTVNNLAWQLACAPDRGDAEEAVRLARRVVAMEPAEPNFRNTLGVSLYRAGHLAEAAAVLESNAPLNPNAGLDWLFLAACNRRLGREAQARATLARALRWRAAVPRMAPAADAEFRMCLAEVERVVNGSSDGRPADHLVP